MVGLAGGFREYSPKGWKNACLMAVWHLTEEIRQQQRQGGQQMEGENGHQIQFGVQLSQIIGSRAGEAVLCGSSRRGNRDVFSGVAS